MSDGVYLLATRPSGRFVCAVHLGVENVHKVGAIGKAGYGWETKIVDENGNAVERGEVGELAVRGPGVMLCYFNDEKATNEVLHGNWLFTGDMAQEDEDGFIFLVDRKKDVIISGGENLYPVQIEDFLRKNDAIKDVAVIGIPDARLGEIAAAVIEVKPDYTLTEEEVNEQSKRGATISTGDIGQQHGLVNINTATVQELTSLTGIGESRALAIIAYREEKGLFKSIDGIKKVAGIKEGLFEKIKNKITV